MNIDQMKEKIKTYVLMLDSDDGMKEYDGRSVNRNRSKLVRTFSGRSQFQEAYQALLDEGMFHEEGSGKPGDPIIIKTGPAAQLVSALPYKINREILDKFAVRLAMAYYDNGWESDENTVSRELQKALESYQFGRPY